MECSNRKLFIKLSRYTLLDFLPKSEELIMIKDFYLHLINITNKTDLNITII